MKIGINNCLSKKKNAKITQLLRGRANTLLECVQQIKTLIPSGSIPSDLPFQNPNKLYQNRTEKIKYLFPQLPALNILFRLYKSYEITQLF